MEVEQRGYTVGEVARIAGVTVRTLHHYDEIGLLVPSQRSDAGYRLYAAAELDRLREVLTFRELGSPATRSASTRSGPRSDPDPRRGRVSTPARIEWFPALSGSSPG